MPDTRFKDLTGQKFGDLTVTKFAGWYVSPSGSRHSKWIAKCSVCGSEREYTSASLNKRLKRRGCGAGCMTDYSNRSRPVVDLTGKRFGKLFVVEQAEEQIKGKSQRWVCKCDCGNEVIVTADHLVNGVTQSCGCDKRKLALKKLKNHFDKVYVEDTCLDRLTNKPTIRSKTGVRGVYPYGERYVAKITLQGKVKHLGYFNTLDEAREARRKAEEEMFQPILDKYKGEDEK